MFKNIASQEEIRKTHELIENKCIFFFVGNVPFYRGLLLNAGFFASLEHLPFVPDCFYFYDGNHVPLSEGIEHACSYHGPLHIFPHDPRYTS